jgi:hypothetical protein
MMKRSTEYQARRTVLARRGLRLRAATTVRDALGVKLATPFEKLLHYRRQRAHASALVAEYLLRGHGADDALGARVRDAHLDALRTLEELVQLGIQHASGDELVLLHNVGARPSR